MTHPYMLPKASLLLAATLGLAACGGGDVDLVAVASVARIQLDPESLELELHEERALQATPLSEDGARLHFLPVTFVSDDPSIATVGADGMVRAILPGETTIRVSCEGRRAEARVRVWAPIHSIHVSPDAASPIVGQEVLLQAEARDEFGTPAPERTFVWTSTKPEVAVVDETGKVTALRAGVASIVASAGGKEGAAAITVRAAVDRIEIDPPTDSVRVNGKARFRATTWDSRGRQLEDRAITWASTDPAIATVDEGGTATGLALGEVEIVATSEGVEGRATFKVLDVPVARIEIVPPSPKLLTGDTLAFDAILYDRDGNVLVGRPVDWKVVESTRVASIDPATGVALAERPGKVTIEAHADGMHGRTDLQVRLRLVSVTAGDGHTCGLSPIGQAWCWGSNETWQLGQQPRGNQKTSFSALPVDTDQLFASLSAGAGHTCGVALDGTGWCWGRNDRGQLGNNSRVQSSEAVPVGAGLKFRSIHAGYQATCGLATDGKLWCWGRGEEWQLANQWPEDRLVPDWCAQGFEFDDVSVGFLQTCAITSANEAFCWGTNRKGLGQEGVLQWPVPLRLDLEASAIGVGEEHACALDLDGAAWCWGDRNVGSLGDNFVPPGREFRAPYGYYSRHPVAVHGGHRFVDLRVAGKESCGVDHEGAIWCWGFHVAGGHPTWWTPQRFGTTLKFRDISMGRTHTCGVTAEDVVYCWGVNTSGEIGQPVSPSGNTIVTPVRL
ncbi:MAG TPA: Ig-like domain-containing protein, partial [Vulgatibacter sp.]